MGSGCMAASIEAVHIQLTPVPGLRYIQDRLERTAMPQGEVKMMRTIVAIGLALLCGNVWAGSLDIAPGGYGLSVGNSKRITGLRINARDTDVEQVNGVNLTLWKAGKNPAAKLNGIAAGLVGPEGQQINGLALGLLGAGAHGSIRGISIGGLGSGAGDDITGVSLGLLGAGAGDSVTGVMIGGLGAGAGESVTGVVIGGIGAGAGNSIKGIAIGGVGAGAGREATGLVFGIVGAGAGERMRGIAIGGFGAGAGQQITGVALSLLRVKAGERIVGAAAGLVVSAKEIRGVTVGGANGIEFRDWVPRKGTDLFTGLSIGVLNCTEELHGLQLGLLNYAGNNPSWARWLPLLNLHF